MTYKNYIIEKETDYWAIKYCGNFRFYHEDFPERPRSASSIEEAQDEIDELTYKPLEAYVKVSTDLPATHFYSFMEAVKFALYWNADLLIKENDVLAINP